MQSSEDREEMDQSPDGLDDYDRSRIADMECRPIYPAPVAEPEENEGPEGFVEEAA